MKVLYLADGLPVGGQERQLALLLDYLPATYERVVLALDGGPFLPVIEGLGWPVEVHSRSWRYDVTPACSIFRKIRDWRPDIVHSWGWMSTAAAAPICRALTVPFIEGTIRTARAGWPKRLAHAPGMLLSSRVVTNSRASLRGWAVPHGKGRVVYNGFDPARLALCEGHVSAPTPFRVVMTGRMTPVKDFDAFLSAAGLLAAADPGWRFDVVGDGPMKEELMSRAGGLVANGVVVFHGGLLEVLDVVRDAHAGVLMTNPEVGFEGCSNSIMEYMACALPVVCSQGGGNAELVLNGETGYLVAPSDFAQLAARLEDLRRDRVVATEMGTKGKKRLLDRFSAARMVADMEDVYAEAAQQRGRVVSP